MRVQDEAPTRTGRCEGCSTPGATLHRYHTLLRTLDGCASHYVAWYCDGCADLAAVDYSGTIITCDGPF